MNLLIPPSPGRCYAAEPVARTLSASLITLKALAGVAALAALAATYAPGAASAHGASRPRHAVSGPLGVLVANVQAAGQYDVALVDGVGGVVAVTRAARRADIEISGGQGGGALSMPLPPVSASRTRVYFLDGDRRVRSLAPNGTVTSVTTVPGSAHAHATFAVSPDDRRIAVGVLTYSGAYTGANSTRVHIHNGATTTRIYVEDVVCGHPGAIVRGCHSVEIFRSASAYEWPVAWHNGALVLAVAQLPGTQSGSPNPYFAYDGYHVVDASSGRRLATMCAGQDNDQIFAYGPLVSAGTLCIRGANQTPYVDDWAGGRRRLPGAPTSYTAVLAPDGRRFADVDSGGHIVIEAANGARTVTGLKASPLGWIDPTHLIVDSGTNSGPDRVFNPRTGVVSTIDLRPPHPLFFGVLPAYQ